MRALMSHVLPRVAQVALVGHPIGHVINLQAAFRCLCVHATCGTQEVCIIANYYAAASAASSPWIVSPHHVTCVCLSLSVRTCVYLSLFDAPSKMDARVLSPDQLGGFRVVAQFARRGPPDSRTSSADYYLRVATTYAHTCSVLTK